MRARVRDMLASLMGRRRIEADLDDELRDHLERDIEWRISRGVSPAEARRLALAELGGVERTRDEVRDAHGITALVDLWRDLRFAGRRLRRAPLWTLLTATTVALGIGAATAVFTVVDGILLKPLPFPAPSELVTLWQTRPGVGVTRDDVAPATFLDWGDRVRSVTSLSAGNPHSVNLRSATATDNVEAWQVSAAFFEMLALQPHLGRTFRPEDFQRGGAPVVLLDHGFWQRRFGGDRTIIGTSLTLDDVSHTVVGVLPAGFELPERTSLWMPWIPDEEVRADRFGTYLKVFGRLTPGTTLAGAQAELATVAQALEREHPRSNRGVGAIVIPLDEVVVGTRRSLLFTLLGAAAVLLVVTVANVAALHLTRLARQRRETLIRMSLGAGRLAVARPLVAEAVVLSLMGGGAGTAVGWLGTRLLHAHGPPDLPRLAQVQLDGRALLVSLVLALAVALVLTVLSVARLTRQPDAGVLGARSVAGSPLSRRVRHAAVGLQLALSLVLLIGTSLLVRSFLHVLSAERGYDTANVLSFTTWVYGEYPDPQRREGFARTVLERLRTLPGVTHAALGSALPLADEITGEAADVVMEGTAVPQGEEPQSRAIVVWPSWFETLGIRLVRGRTLGVQDDARGERVVVVNEAFVRRFSPERDPIGRMVSVGLMGRGVPRRIVGVVADTRHARLDGPAEPGVFIPWLQQPLAAITFVIRASRDAEALAPAVTQLLFEVDARVGLARLATLDALMDQRLRERRFLTLLLASFAGVAIVLSCVGVFGVMSQAVAERTREIGVRLALGATPRAILAQLIGEAGTLALAGIVAGLAVAAVAMRGLAGFLFGVAPFDPLSLSLAVGALAMLSLVAALVPTLRAARTEPSVVLQGE